LAWRWLTSIDELVKDSHAVGTLCLPPETPLFADHFPSFPVVPGVILLEAMAQLSGKLIGYSVRHARGDWPFPILSMANNVKFRKFVRPDELAVLEAKVVALREESAVMDVRTRVDGKVCAQAEEVFVFNAVPLGGEADGARLEALERAELARLWKGYPGD
jgi:3-hydroxymyristoyl/3-hydroxydecanoyl-(acyl carrier protein) dehydratase